MNTCSSLFLLWSVISVILCDGTNITPRSKAVLEIKETRSSILRREASKQKLDAFSRVRSPESDKGDDFHKRFNFRSLKRGKATQSGQASPVAAAFNSKSEKHKADKAIAMHTSTSTTTTTTTTTLSPTATIAVAGNENNNDNNNNNNDKLYEIPSKSIENKIGINQTYPETTWLNAANMMVSSTKQNLKNSENSGNQNQADIASKNEKNSVNFKDYFEWLKYFSNQQKPHFAHNGSMSDVESSDDANTDTPIPTVQASSTTTFYPMPTLIPTQHPFETTVKPIPKQYSDVYTQVNVSTTAMMKNDRNSHNSYNVNHNGHKASSSNTNTDINNKSDSNGSNNGHGNGKNTSSKSNGKNKNNNRNDRNSKNGVNVATGAPTHSPTNSPITDNKTSNDIDTRNEPYQHGKFWLITLSVVGFVIALTSAIIMLPKYCSNHSSNNDHDHMVLV